MPVDQPLRGIGDDAEKDNNARYWEMINAMYAQTFSIFLVYANRVGFEDGVGFWGGSEILDPSGKHLAKAKYYDTDMIAAEINLKAARRQRVASPLLRDEDIDLTINELLRIRGREAEVAKAPVKVAEAVRLSRKPRAARSRPAGRASRRRRTT
jgi:hypothetical protein